MRKYPVAEIDGVQDSTDALSHSLTGWEWVRVLGLLKSQSTYILGVLFNVVPFSAPFFTSHLQGRLASSLIQSDFATPTDFVETVNSLCGEMIAVIFIRTSCRSWDLA
jgi:hypothetical protein